jgi:hypothetical protein
MTTRPLTVNDVKDLVLRHGAEFAVVLAYFDGPGMQYVTYGTHPEAKVCASDLSEQISDCIDRGLCPAMLPSVGPAKVLESFKLEAGRIKADNERLREVLELVVRDVGEGGPASDYVSCYTMGRVRAALGR